MKPTPARTAVSLGLGLLILATAYGLSRWFPQWVALPAGWNLALLVALLAGIWSGATLLTLATAWLMSRGGRPAVEGLMVGRLYHLVSLVVMILVTAFAFNKLDGFGSLFSMFGGMLLGWSLQAPVSGFAAWMLVSVKRPFRPGDRVQFPSLGLTGDVKDIGVMYVVLDQVGGTVGSEEAVGRHILVPNAMLFSQVVINFTVKQEAAYMLDEVIVRITYDSDLETAERILTEAARETTAPIITATGKEPYIRSDLYDYGIYLRLRYQTQVQDRARIAYEINKRITQAFQRTPSVDFAIPFIYSYRAGLDQKEEDAEAASERRELRQIDIARIRHPVTGLDLKDIEQLAHSIATQGLLQPIVVKPVGDGRHYDIVAGHLRFEACKRLGWKTISAAVKPGAGAPTNGGGASA